MRAVMVAVTVLITGWASAQAVRIEVESESGAHPWTHLDVNNDPDSFQFAIVTDRTGGHRPGVFMDGVHKLNLMQPEFVMSVGDLIEGYTENPVELMTQWKQFDGFVDQLEMPFFYVAGNHDISNAVMEQVWKTRFGALYYHFVYKNVLFLCLDSEDPPSSQMSEAQADYVRETLDNYPDVRWTMVFMHKPLWAYGDPKTNGWQRIEDLLKDRPHSVFAGHTHRYFKYDKYGSEYVVLATMGGGSRLRGPNFGEFDHFLWVTMTDEGPRFANLMLDGIWDTNVVTERRIDLIRPVVGGAAVRTDGIVIENGILKREKTTLRIRNDADIPMKVSVSIPPTDVVTPSVTHYADTIPPNSVKLVDLVLTAASPVAVVDLAPLRARWTIEYAPEGDLMPLRLSGTHRIVFDTAHALTPVHGITVDGALSDWGRLRVQPREPGAIDTVDGAWQGNHDASLQFSVGYDADNVYVAVAARDDEIRRSRRQDYARQDALIVWLDVRDESKWTDLTGDAGRYRFVLLPGADDIFFPEEIPGDVQAHSVMTEDGYLAEIAIPLRYVTALQGDDWKSIRVNLGMNDVDADGTTRVLWRPDWSGPADYAGAGRFERP